MNHRVIRGVLMAALLLFVPLWTARALAADIDGALAYVPKDSFTVIVANVDQVRTSPVFEQMRTTLFASEPEAKANIEKLKKETGFDVFADIHTIVIALGSSITSDDGDFCAIAEAPANEAKMVAFIKKTGGKIEKKTGPSGKYYLLGSNKDGRMAFRDKFIILCGAKAFDAALAKQGMTPELKTHLDTVNTHDIYAATKTTEAVRQKLENDDKKLAQLDTASAGLSLKSGIDFVAIANFLTAAPAKELAKMANEGLAEAKKAKELQKLGLTTYLNKIGVKAAAKKLTAKLKLTADEVKKLSEILNGLL